MIFTVLFLCFVITNSQPPYVYTTNQPSSKPSNPTYDPTASPSSYPSEKPTSDPTFSPTTPSPTNPTYTPTTAEPSVSFEPTISFSPTPEPSTGEPTYEPTNEPTTATPTAEPTTAYPTEIPTPSPSSEYDPTSASTIIATVLTVVAIVMLSYFFLIKSKKLPFAVARFEPEDTSSKPLNIDETTPLTSSSA